MVKNKTGGKNHKKMASKNEKVFVNKKIPLIKDSKEKNQLIYGIVEKVYGGGRFNIKCNDGKLRLLEMRRKFAGRNKRDNTVKLNTIVLAGKREWQLVNDNKIIIKTERAINDISIILLVLDLDIFKSFCFSLISKRFSRKNRQGTRSFGLKMNTIGEKIGLENYKSPIVNDYSQNENKLSASEIRKSRTKNPQPILGDKPVICINSNFKNNKM